MNKMFQAIICFTFLNSFISEKANGMQSNEEKIAEHYRLRQKSKTVGCTATEIRQLVREGYNPTDSLRDSTPSIYERSEYGGNLTRRKKTEESAKTEDSWGFGASVFGHGINAHRTVKHQPTHTSVSSNSTHIYGIEDETRATIEKTAVISAAAVTAVAVGPSILDLIRECFCPRGK